MLWGNSRNRKPARTVATGVAAVLFLAAAPAAADPVPDFRPEQWGLQSIDTQQLWEETQGQGVTVGMPGFAVDEEHPDVDGNVTVDTEFGSDGDTETGTAAASLVAGHGHGFDADAGVLGVAPRAELLVLPTDKSLPSAIRRAIDSDVQVILLPETDGSVNLTNATRDAADAGILVVGPAGGEEYPDVLAVGGVDENGELVDGSPDAEEIDLLAPGADLVAAGPDLGQEEVTGAEYAAAMAAGAAALLRAAYPQLFPDQIRSALVDGAQQGTEGLPSLHLPTAQAQAEGAAQNTQLVDGILENREEQDAPVPVWVWLLVVGAVLVLGIAMVVLWVRRSTKDPYGVQAERELEEAEIARERAATAPPATRRKGGRRRKR